MAEADCREGVGVENTVKLRRYVSKITWNRAKGTIFVYGKGGAVLWGVAEGREIPE